MVALKTNKEKKKTTKNPKVELYCFISKMLNVNSGFSADYNRQPNCWGGGVFFRFDKNIAAEFQMFI